MDDASGAAPSNNNGNIQPNSFRTKTIPTEEMIKILNTQPEHEGPPRDAIPQTTDPSNSSRRPTISTEQMINILSLYEYTPAENTNLKRFLGNHKTFEMTDLVSCFSSSFKIQPVNAGFDSLYNLLLNRSETSYSYNCYAKIDNSGLNCYTSNVTQQELYICNGEYRITVVNRPTVNNRGRAYNILIPETSEPIGWINIKGNVSNIHVPSAEPPHRFFMFRLKSSDNPLEVVIEDHTKQRVATGMVTKWTKTRTNGIVTGTSFNTFQFTIGDFNIETRAVLFASFAVMMHDRTEHSLFWCKFKALAWILILFIFLVFALNK